MSILKPIRGMHDQFPEQCEIVQQLLKKILQVVEAHGYRQIQLPTVESSELFKRSVGLTSDIVQKEMYTFSDRNDDSVSLRPEGTAGCFRAYLSNCQRAAPFQRFWYYGPMFRRERPQKGRQREFYQFGIEAFGYDHPCMDVELLKVCFELFKVLKIDHLLSCKINYLGCSSTRSDYLNKLRDYFKPYVSEFDETHQYRYEQNVLRLFDSKDSYVQSLLDAAPKLIDHLSDTDMAQYELIKNNLSQLGIPYVEDATLVRGLDYYSGLIFEWEAISGLGSQNTICAGGRTDKLSELLGGKPGFSLGMAIGIERLIMLINQPTDHIETVFLFTNDENRFYDLLKLQMKLKDNGIKSFAHFGISQLKKQLNRAVNMKYKFALQIIDDQLQFFDLIKNENQLYNTVDEIGAMYYECRT